MGRSIEIIHAYKMSLDDTLVIMDRRKKVFVDRLKYENKLNPGTDIDGFDNHYASYIVAKTDGVITHSARLLPRYESMCYVLWTGYMQYLPLFSYEVSRFCSHGKRVRMEDYDLKGCFQRYNIQTWFAIPEPRVLPYYENILGWADWQHYKLPEYEHPLYIWKMPR